MEEIGGFKLTVAAEGQLRGLIVAKSNKNYQWGLHLRRIVTKIREFSMVFYRQKSYSEKKSCHPR